MHRVETPRTVCRCFRTPARPWLPSGASGSCGMAAAPPLPTQAHAGLGVPRTPASATRLHHHRSTKEPTRRRGSGGASPREPPSPGCPTQRGPWKVGGALPGALGWPSSTHTSPQGPPPPLTLGPDTGLWLGFLYRGLFRGDQGGHASFGHRCPHPEQHLSGQRKSHTSQVWRR